MVIPKKKEPKYQPAIEVRKRSNEGLREIEQGKAKVQEVKAYISNKFGSTLYIDQVREVLGELGFESDEENHFKKNGLEVEVSQTDINMLDPKPVISLHFHYNHYTEQTYIDAADEAEREKI